MSVEGFSRACWMKDFRFAHSCAAPGQSRTSIEQDARLWKATFLPQTP